ncbi:MAG: Arm DNA-binding domain-containing protein [Syntrophales bacterium]|nr:Arm DNA-binding domain-containing protein [Syntrophales bacterium]
MPKRIPPLSDSQIENVSHGDKPFRLYDGQGLFLEVMPNGSKLWRYKYRFGGKAKILSFGAYPAVHLSDARLQRSEAQLLRKQGIDPSAVRKLSKSREDAEKMLKDQDRPSVRAVIDGTFEIWKGRSVLRFTSEEAQFVRDLLNKLL